MKITIPLLGLFLTFSTFIYGQGESSIIIPYNDSLKSPQSSLNDVKWLTGNWYGKAMGGIIEEVWSPPLGESMMCMFKLVIEGKIKFYEFITISEENNSLIMKIKHFNNNMVGWEEKDKTVDFKLVKVTEKIVYFDNFTFEKVNENELNIYVLFQNNEEAVKFNYKKVVTH